MKHLATLFTLGVCTLSAGAVWSQSPFLVQVADASGGPGTEVTTSVLLDADEAVIAWSYGICEAGPIQLVDLASGATTLTVNNGAAPDFESLDLVAGGATHAVVICFMACDDLGAGVGYELAIVTVSLDGAAGDTGTLCPCSGLGQPPVDSVVVRADYTGVIPDVSCGTLDHVGVSDFVRGDCNGDGTSTLIDATFLLGFIFLGQMAPTCEDGCDADDLGSFGLPDVLRILFYLFSDGPPPEPPFGACGPDPTDDALTCESYDVCP